MDRGFQYPIPTYSITRDFDWSDTENNRLLFEMTSQSTAHLIFPIILTLIWNRVMCVPCAADCVWILRELRKKTGGFFGSGESTGSVGVVTINMPRIAYLSATIRRTFTSASIR